MNDVPVSYVHAEINRAWSDAEKLGLLRCMLRSRRFEQKAMHRFLAGRMGGWLILGIGQESIAASARSLMGRYDHTITGCRGMGHALAAGMGMDACMAELYGHANGCSKGKAGAFGFYAPHLRHWGCHAYAGSQTPLAAGLAFGIKHRGEPGAVICFLGDGAVNTGAYHEALNLSGLFHLPVVYVIENNGYAMGTSVQRSSAFRGCLAQRAETYDIAWDHFTDADPYEIRARLHVALERARQDRLPTVVEISTYRYFGFTISDANQKRYRTPEEIEQHKATDPLNAWMRHLADRGLIGEAEIEHMDQEIRAEVLTALDAAESGSAPRIEDIRGDVYWETDHETPASRTGRCFFDPE